MSVSGAMRQVCLAGAMLACLGAFGCRHDRRFMWVDAVPNSMLAPESAYQIAPGDVIGIRVWNQEANSIERAYVRDDGMISLPFLNDVAVAGIQPADLARLLELKLKAFIVNPVVTVVLHERHPLRVSVAGKVARPGVYVLDRGSGVGVLHALVAAGGPTPFADEDAIYVLRSGYWADGHPEPGRIRFRYGDLLSGKAPASVFSLRAGDVVVVE